MSLRTPLPCSLAALALACGVDIDPLVTDGTTEPPPSSTPPGSSDPSPDGTSSTGDDPTGEPPPSAGGVDILFVIDNSGSMANAQRELAASIGGLIEPLESAGVDYRLAVTTTDNSNPRCPKAQTTPELGDLVGSSCIDRAQQGEFEFNQDDYSFACVDVCALDDDALARVPTTTEVDATPRPRQWIERIGGVSNLSADVTPAEAAACILPQGVAGCGFEQPLESMFLALAKATHKDSPANYGFLRDAADLLVVFVTDELDCSFTNGHSDIFTTNKVFWNNPDDPAPTSAVCWRAATQCSGSAPDWDTCTVADRGADGELSSPDDAVLQPVSRYIDFLQALNTNKQIHGAKVRVAAITGVPSGWPDASLVFSDGDDPDYLRDFGIGPGCLAPDPGDPTLVPIRAVPPLRLKEVVESLPIGPGLFSICEGIEVVPGTLAPLLLQP